MGWVLLPSTRGPRSPVEGVEIGGVFAQDVGLRTFWVGVSSARTAKSASRMRNRLMLSALETAASARSTAYWTAASRPGSSARSPPAAGLVGPQLPPGERRGVQRDERGDVGPLVAGHDALADQPVLPDPVFEHRGRQARRPPGRRRLMRPRARRPDCATARFGGDRGWSPCRQSGYPPARPQGSPQRAAGQQRRGRVGGCCQVGGRGPRASPGPGGVPPFGRKESWRAGR